MTTLNKNITKETRVLSYSKILENLGERQKLVYIYMSAFSEGATAKELSTAMYKDGLVDSPERNSVHPRLNELVKLEFLEVVGKKTCQYTNRKVAVYKYKK